MHTFLAASSISGCPAPRRPYPMLKATVSLNKTRSWGTDPRAPRRLDSCAQAGRHMLACFVRGCESGACRRADPARPKSAANRAAPRVRWQQLRPPAPGEAARCAALRSHLEVADVCAADADLPGVDVVKPGGGIRVCSWFCLRLSGARAVPVWCSTLRWGLTCRAGAARWTCRCRWCPPARTSCLAVPPGPVPEVPPAPRGTQTARHAARRPAARGPGARRLRSRIRRWGSFVGGGAGRVRPAEGPSTTPAAL